MAHLDIGGISTWYTAGEAPSGLDDAAAVLLLHGGLSNSDALLDSIGVPLGTQYRIAAFDRRGHGYTADSPEPFHYDTMVDETIAVIEHIGGPVHIVGWSDGGIIGLMLALRRPDLMGRLVAIGANFHFNGGEPSHHERPQPNPIFEMLRAGYVERTPDGEEHFPAIRDKTFHMFGTEPSLTVDDLATIALPVLVMAADDDVIALSHTCAMYEAIPGAQLSIVPASSHAVPEEQPDEVARIIAGFLERPLPITTRVPIRRP